MSEKGTKTAFIQTVEAVAKQMANDVKPQSNKALIILGIEKGESDTQTAIAVTGEGEQMLTGFVGLFSIPQIRDLAVRALSVAALKDAMNLK